MYLGNADCGQRAIPMEAQMKPERKERNPTSEKPEHVVDKTVEDTFPASDPPAAGGTTRIESDDAEAASGRARLRSSEDAGDVSVFAATPAVLAQPTADTFPFPRSAEPKGATTLDKRPSEATLQARFAGTCDALASRYRDASDATDQFVRQDPWKAIAFAVLGGVVIGMLAAR